MDRMKSLSREEDVQSTVKAMEQAPSYFISIPDKKTPWYFINLDFADGFVHWYKAGGQPRRVVCSGGLEGKGFATSTCPLCIYVLELYQEAKRLDEEGEKAKAKQVRTRANDLHAKGEVQLKAIRGQRTLLKTKTGKEWIADWDVEDEDSTVDVGIVSLSEAQFLGLKGMVKGDNTPFILVGDDLNKRVLWTSKEHRKGRSGGKYSQVVWDADKEESDMPEMEVDQELLDIDLRDNFVIDEEEVEKVFALVSGQEIEEVAEDEQVALEGDSEEVPENAELDDLPDDGDPDENAKEEEFKDDLPYPVPEEAPEPEPKPSVERKVGEPEKTTTTTGGKKTTLKIGGRKTNQDRKSGKARM
jgi:hypothetical protein